MRARTRLTTFLHVFSRFFFFFETNTRECRNLSRIFRVSEIQGRFQGIAIIFAKRERGDPLYIFTQNHTLFLFVQSYTYAHIGSPKRKRDKVHAAREELSSSSEEENKDLSVIKVVVDRHKQQAKISSSRFFFILLNTSLSSPIFEW